MLVEAVEFDHFALLLMDEGRSMLLLRFPAILVLDEFTFSGAVASA